jgi:PAS domain S-box-containing protein
MLRKSARVENEIARKRQNKEHEQVLDGILKQLQPVFYNSQDGVYLYLDDNHKVCNRQMAEMFGMTVEEWNRTPDFLQDFVAPQDREVFAANYQKHVALLTGPVTFRFNAIRKNGEAFLAETEMIPVTWDGYPIAYHFVREVK